VCYLEDNVCYFEDYVCYFEDYVCYFEDNVCYLEDNVCYLEDNTCYLEDYTCYFEDYTRYFKDYKVFINYIRCINRILMGHCAPFLVRYWCNIDFTTYWDTVEAKKTALLDNVKAFKAKPKEVKAEE